MSKRVSPQWILEGDIKGCFDHISHAWMIDNVCMDDFIVTGHSKEILENDIKPAITAFLRERGLELSQEKTRVTHITEGFDFLGQNVRKYPSRGKLKLLIKPAKKNIHSFLEEIRCIFR